MRLATFIPPGGDEPRAGEVRGEEVVSFDAGTVRDRLESGDRSPADGAAFPLAEVTLLAPVPRPRAIFGIGRNYAAHAAELGNVLPEAPLVFMKLPTSSVPPAGPGAVPGGGAAARLRGRAGRGDRRGRPDRRLGGRRRRQRPRPAGRRGAVDAREGLRHLVPVGPVDHDRRRAPRRDRAAHRVMGQRRAAPGRAPPPTSSSARSALVDFIAETCTLEPGDLILTGTPDGVGKALKPPRYLEPGDVVRIEIERLGTIEHEILAPLM